MEKERINLPPTIELEWSDWTAWDAIKVDARRVGGVKIPRTPGVYEAKYKEDEKRLTIGKASNLRERVRNGLVKGRIPHGPREDMRFATERFSEMVVRWAVTDRPAAAEEEIHRLRPPKYGMADYIRDIKPPSG